MKPFKIKAIKTYVSYITTSLFYISCGRKCIKKMVPSQRIVQYSHKDKPNQSQIYIIMIYETILTKKAKNSGGMKNKLYCKRSQDNRYTIFQVISTVVRAIQYLILIISTAICMYVYAYLTDNDTITMVVCIGKCNNWLHN